MGLDMDGKPNVLLINANPYQEVHMSSYGLEIIQSYSEKDHGDWCNIHIANPFHEDFNPVAVISKKVVQLQPILIGLSIRNYNECLTVVSSKEGHEFGTNEYLNEIKDLIIEMRNVCGDVPIVAGGAAFTFFSEQMLSYLSLDYGVIGPGEYTFSSIIGLIRSQKFNKEELLKLPGLIVNEDRTFLRNPAQYRLEDEQYFNVTKDSQFNGHYEFPRRHYAYYSKYVFPVRTHTGCGLKCSYCVESLNQHVSYRPLSNVIQEVEYLIQTHSCKRVFFTSAEMNVPDVSYLINLCKQMIANGLHKKIKWTAFFNVVPFTEELASLLKESGCERVSLSIDNFDNRILRTLRKNFSFEDIVRTLELCEKYGLKTESNIFFGAPGETWDIVNHNIEKMKYYIGRGHQLWYLIGIIAYPGTEIHRIKLQAGDCIEHEYQTNIYSSSRDRHALMEYVKNKLMDCIDVSQYMQNSMASDDKKLLNMLIMQCNDEQIDHGILIYNELCRRDERNLKTGYFLLDYFHKKNDKDRAAYYLSHVREHFSKYQPEQPLDYVIYDHLLRFYDFTMQLSDKGAMAIEKI